MPPEISQIEEERRRRFNQAMAQEKTENESLSENPPRKTLSFGDKISKYWPILVAAFFFDLFALIPFLSVIINFCFGIVMFLYFGKKKVVSGIIAPIVIGSIIDFFLSLILISLWPACLAAVITRIALKETMG